MENYIEYIKNQVEEHIRNVPIEVNTAIGDDEGNNYKYKERNEKIFDDFLENQDFEIEKDIKKEKIKLCFLIDKIANKYNLGNIGKNSRRQIIETLFIPDENGNILCFDCSNCIDCYKCVNCNKCEQCSLCINSNNMFPKFSILCGKIENYHTSIYDDFFTDRLSKFYMAYNLFESPTSVVCDISDEPNNLPPSYNICINSSTYNDIGGIYN